MIGKILSQLTLDNLRQWNLIAFFFWKMIPAKISYKTYDCNFLAIIEALKTWRHYPKSCKHKVLILIDYNNFHLFIDTKSLSFK